ncbi:glycosyltransferase family 39 protein [Aquisphaera insulae]|uniref:glycosyltransferase family 39 protein n=1 Tax=Aquisphaera insulae TaxID=2712864 RepID=UPI0013EE2C46|nr:glycosyltransferase family 39 protein [Aquisphaera insulae]
MLDLAMALFLALISAGIGKRLLGSWVELPEHPADVFALTAPLGLGILSMGCLVVGTAGWLNLVGLAVLLAVATELGIFSGARLVREYVAYRDPDVGGRPAGWADRVIGICLGITLASTAFAALVPVTDGDALCYHLQVPKVFLVRQAIVFDPDLHETIYPLITELLYAIALEFRGPVACRCLQWVLGLVFAAGVTALARPVLGRKAWWAGTVAVMVPAVSNGMSAPLNDVSLAAFGVAAVLAWSRAMRSPTAGSWAFAGVFAGLALGVKYPALVLLCLLVASTMARAVTHGGWRCRTALAGSLRNAATMAVAAFLVGGVWYMRAAVYTGNPVYPFFKPLFGGAGLDEVLDPIKRPLAVTTWNMLTSIAPLSLDPARFDSFAHQFGPAFLLFLPALLVERAPRRVLGLSSLGYAFLAACMTQRQSMRFLLIALGPMSVGVGYLACRWSERRTIAARALTAAFLLVLCLEAGIAMTRGARAATTVLGRESMSQFLARLEPSYRVGAWIARNLPESARVIGQDHRGFYIPRDYTMELAHRRRTGLGGKGESADEIVETLRKEGYTHLMLCPPEPSSDVEFDGTLGGMLSPWLDGHAPVYREDLADVDGVVRHYSIYGLEDPAREARKRDEGKRTR